MKLKVLFTSDILYDMDLALFKYIKDKLPMKKYFKLDKLEHCIEKPYLIHKRSNENPLSIIIQDEYSESIKSLYNDFITKKYKEIFKYYQECNTEIEKLFRILNTNKEISIDVLCKNLMEEQLFKDKYKCHTIVNKDYIIDMSDYSAIYTRYFSLFNKLDNLNAKNIYITNSSYNYDDEVSSILDVNTQLKLTNSNSISIINLYNIN